MIYLDNAATTKCNKETIDLISEELKNYWYNSSAIYFCGAEAKNRLEGYRQEIANNLNCSPEEIYFTSGATEANNQVINNFKNSFIICSSIEHKSVIEPVIYCNAVNMDYIKCKEDGVVSLEDLKTILDLGEPDVQILVTTMYVNNIMGTIQPIKEIKDLIKTYNNKNIYLHTDATQATGHIKIDIEELGVDYLTLSGHKFGAPKGIGILYVRKGSPISALLRGGGQERGKRSGTENLPYIAAFAKRLDCVNSLEVIEKRTQREKKYKEIIFTELNKNKIEYMVFGDENKKISSVFMIAFKNYSGEALTMLLDNYGVMVSTGSACGANSPEPDYIIEMLNPPKEYKNGGIRISFGEDTTEEEIYEFVKILKRCLDILKTM